VGPGTGKNRRVVAARLAALLCATLPAAAHVIQVTGVTIRTDSARTTVAITAHLPLLAGSDPAVELPRRLRLRLDDIYFRSVAFSITRDPAGDTLTWEGHEERRAGSFKFEAPIFPDVPGDTTVVAVYRDGRLIDRAALTPQHPEAVLGENTTAVIRRFVEMGIAHILSGPDHILFVLGLILAGGSFRRLLGIVSAFTLAHSITLSCTALGVATLSPRIVEPMIAFSIVVVGVENLLTGKPKFAHRVAMAFGFGFFHGFGFAGALTESGLPQNAIAASLAAFNIGVELGQGLIVALAVPLLTYLHHRSPALHLKLVRAVAALIAIAGAVWFVQRVFA
jgi:hydrogenase/urease accessory protein HupE